MEEEKLFNHFKEYFYKYLEINRTKKENEIIKLIEEYKTPLNEEERSRFILFRVIINDLYYKALKTANEHEQELTEEHIETLIKESFSNSNFKVKKEN